MKNAEIGQGWSSTAFPMGGNKASSLAYNFAKLVARFQLMPASKTRVREMRVAFHVGDVGPVFTATT